MLLFSARQTTKDVDVFIIRPDPPRLREAAAEVARDLELPEDWLNDAAKGYFVSISEGELVYESSALVVRAVTIEQLLAMKLAAWRDAIDLYDARLLLSKMQGSASEIWLRLEPFIRAATLTRPPTRLMIFGVHSMELRSLVDAVLAGDLLTARQWVADARHEGMNWSAVPYPSDFTGRRMTVAAGLVELLADRAGEKPPPWTEAIGGERDPVVLDPGLDQMPRSFARAKAAGPESLRKRNLVALPDFLEVA